MSNNAIPLPAGPTAPTAPQAQTIPQTAAISDEELRKLLAQNAQFAEEIANLQIAAAVKDTRIFPLNARRVLAWISLAFAALAALALLGWAVGPH